ncbi:YHS domain-containing protein [Halarcobacter anaerophilus]|uniref:Phenol 2-monooxygenase n=1 Tax=Halarcobacter anaerophilus TaxID=877500 RepID=A0A4Q0Y116_9BACT|nr:YHS domain-containing protein [Halarcobacter anaerophilus]QDF28732.1 phenol hydroxylase, oxygenase component P3 [Halarcobacter anaerophilus]RXJ61901.1 phenol 2-monooxygenase [Halarcobacter anaerophilus]
MSSSTSPRKKRLSKKQSYEYMTRLGWDTTYQDEKKVHPYLEYEGIKIHDWDAWEDPFRMTMESYWKLQAEKDKKLYSIIDAFAQNNGQKNITDARYVNALKIFLTAVTPIEHNVVSGFANVARQFKGEGATIACQMQAIDELRHYQTQVHTISHYNKYFDGFHDYRTMYDRIWYLSVPKSFADDGSSAGPFEFMIATGFAFEFVLTSLLFVPFMSGAAYNGDMATVTFGFSAQSDESRHMTLGLQAVKFMLEQDADNVPIVQRMMEKQLWRGYRLLSIVSAMMDYMLPNSPTSWAEAVELYIEQNGVALFKDLEKYGIKMPTKILDKIIAEKEHVSHQLWKTLYVHSNATAFHTWIPDEDKMNWLSQKYPNTFDKHYRPILEEYKKKAEKGERYYSEALPCLCQTCQLPLLFTDVMNGKPTVYTHETTEFNGEKFHFCSDECKNIFENEPKKYAQAWLPPYQIFQGNCGGETIPEVLKWYKIENAVDNLDYVGSPDEAMWNKLKNI